MKTLISNPPYNMVWNYKEEEAAKQERFKIGLPPKINANFAFILTALDFAERCILLLPSNIGNHKKEKEIIKKLVNDNIIEAVILLPDKMFESTSISTSIYIFNKLKKDDDIMFLDLSENFEIEEREQKGQIGLNCNKNRTYLKKIKVLNNEAIEKALKTLENKDVIANYSACVKVNEIIKKDYSLKVKEYIEYSLENEDDNSSDLQEIINNINYIAKMKNSCKLTINENLAKQLGLDVENFRELEKINMQNIEEMSKLDLEIIKEDYISFTKNKNEMIFKCNDKYFLSDILKQFFNIWKGQIMMLNTIQNNYLIKLRDVLTQKLMSGEMEIKKDEI